MDKNRSIPNTRALTLRDYFKAATKQFKDYINESSITKKDDRWRKMYSMLNSTSNISTNDIIHSLQIEGICALPYPRCHIEVNISSMRPAVTDHLLRFNYFSRHINGLSNLFHALRNLLDRTEVEYVDVVINQNQLECNTQTFFASHYRFTCAFLRYYGLAMDIFEQLIVCVERNVLAESVDYYAVLELFSGHMEIMEFGNDKFRYCIW